MTVWTSRWQPLRTLGEVLADALRAIGFDARVRVVGGSTFDYYAALADPRNRAQIGPFRWGLDLPVPSDVFGSLLSCDSPNGTLVCDPALDRRVQRATRRTASRPDAAAAEWAAIERDVADRALTVPLANETALEFVSRRVGNVVQHPVWGVLYSQLWVR